MVEVIFLIDQGELDSTFLQMCGAMDPPVATAHNYDMDIFFPLLVRLTAVARAHCDR